VLSQRWTPRQSRWSPLWPVLVPAVPIRQAAASRFRRLSDSKPCFTANPSGLLNAPQRPPQPPQRDDLLFLFFGQDIHSTEGIPHVMVNVLGLAPLAAFQVILIGRFWVIPEALSLRHGPNGEAMVTKVTARGRLAA